MAAPGMTCFNVVIVGAGGLGTPCAWGLLEGWLSSKLFSTYHLELHLIDPEVIELSNLNRQVFFTESDIGLSKVEVLKRRFGALIPFQSGNIRIYTHPVSLNKNNIQTLLLKKEAEHCFVVDATDSVEAKFLINDYCVVRQLPFCYAGVVGEHGQLLTVIPRQIRDQRQHQHEKCLFANTGCLRCLFGDFNEEDILLQSTTCQQAGILGGVSGYFGFLQANSALQYFSQLITVEEPTSQFLRFSLDDCEWSTVLQSGNTPSTPMTFSPKVRSSQITPAPYCPLGCGLKNRLILDLNNVRCPNTFLYTKLSLEQMPAHANLDVRFDSEESAHNVAQSCKEEGYLVVQEPRQIALHLWKLIVGYDNAA